MTDNQTTDPKKQTLARIQRTEAYAERVRKLFAETINEIVALNKSLPVLSEGEMFSFDAQNAAYRHKVERLLRQLHSVATLAIEKGIKLEWEQANAECDKLVESCLGKEVVSSLNFTAFMQHNIAAQAAFIARSEKGLNLSKRVWQSCRQLRDEMEVAITVAIGDGTSAATLSRQIRKYLNEPDLMFRRFQYHEKEIVRDADGNIVYDKNGKPRLQDKLDKNGKPIVKKKWKKKVIKEDGSVRFIDYDKDSYHNEWTGSGYYKSSAQNAMRVARTETNIAYRRADNERWQQLDFVIGQRVQLSRNHPQKDICDKLAGDYPKDFVFDGWHPQCFCFVTPILIDVDEMKKMNEAMLRGETYTPRGKRITEYPENFKQWVRENQNKILASHEAGKSPYFVSNNFGAVQDILNPKKKLTPLQIAKQRHDARTPEQEEAIRMRWQERNTTEKVNNRNADSHQLEEISFGKDFKDLRKKLIRQKNEQMHIVTAKGSIVCSIFGDSRSVNFDEDIAKIAKDRIITHNHPSGKGESGIKRFGYSLSSDDVFETVRCDALGIIAESQTYRYYIMRPPNGWAVGADVIKRRYNEIYDEIRISYCTSMSNHSAYNIVQHLVMKQLSVEFGFEYGYKRL